MANYQLNLTAAQVEAALTKINNGPGAGLKIDGNNRFAVDVATTAQSGSAKPITSGAVYDLLGDVEAVLDEILGV